MDLSFINTNKPKKGSLLIAEPFLDDDYFGRSVVYLCEHNEEGSFGFVLNNFIDIELHTVAENFPNIDTKVSIGGPVETENIYFLHARPDLLENSTLVSHNLYIGGNYTQLLEMLNTGKMTTKEVRFFLGYSGWSIGQLDHELKSNSWLVVESFESKDILDFKLDNIWEVYMKKQGGKYKVMSKFPVNPQDN